VEKAGDFGVWAKFALGDLGKALPKQKGRRPTGAEGDGAPAKFAFGEEEDGAVDEVGVKEGGVEGGAGFDEDAEALALGEEVEDGGEIDVAHAGERDDFDVSGRRGFEGVAALHSGGIGEGGFGAEEEEVGSEGGGDRAQELALRWGAEVGVEDDAKQGAAAWEGGAVGEGGIVSEDGADAGKDGVGGVAQTVDFGTGEWAGEPDGRGGDTGGGWRGEVAVD